MLLCEIDMGGVMANMEVSFEKRESITDGVKEIIYKKFPNSLSQVKFIKVDNLLVINTSFCSCEEEDD
jgi:hypothetical protein